MTAEERSYLECFGPNTYGLEIPRDIAKPMESKGWITWLPPQFGTRLWAITDAGKEAIRRERPKSLDETLGSFLHLSGYR